jgi:hypothetical protein
MSMEGSSSSSDDSNGCLESLVEALEVCDQSNASHMDLWWYDFEAKNEGKLWEKYAIPYSVVLWFANPGSGAIASEKTREVCLREYVQSLSLAFVPGHSSGIVVSS